MIELEDEEKQWLKIFAKENKFFASLLKYYRRKGYLTEKQFACLIDDINEAEEDGDTLLTDEELKFLKDNAKNDQQFLEIFEEWEENGYLDGYEYNNFIHLRVKFTKNTQKNQSSTQQKYSVNDKTYISHERDRMTKIIRIPCPHCHLLCSPQAEFCANCGEPLQHVIHHNEVKETLKESKPVEEKELLNSSNSSKQPTDTYYEKFKELQKKGRLLKEKYKSETIQKLEKHEKHSKISETSMLIEEEKSLPFEKDKHKKNELKKPSLDLIKKRLRNKEIKIKAEAVKSSKLTKSKPKLQKAGIALFAIDVNNLIESFKRMFPNSYINIKSPLQILKKKYLNKIPYKAYFFASKHLEQQKRIIPENKNNKWYIESFRKRKSPYQYADIDVALGVEMATIIEKYKDRISHFYLGSGDKDFHSIIKKAKKYGIPVSLIVCSRNNVSTELLQLVNFDVDILYNN